MYVGLDCWFFVNNGTFNLFSGDTFNVTFSLFSGETFIVNNGIFKLFSCETNIVNFMHHYRRNLFLLCNDFMGVVFMGCDVVVFHWWWWDEHSFKFSGVISHGENFFF